MGQENRLGGWILSEDIDPEVSSRWMDFYGFVYRIDIEDRFYIGKKSFYHKKGRFNKESDWRKYYSSSQYIKDYISKNGTDKVKRTILKICKTKLDLTYWEVHYQVVNMVLFNPKSLNNNILGKFYYGKINV